MTLTEETVAAPPAPSLARLIREHRGRFDLPDLRVHPNDEMLRFGLLAGLTPAVAEMAYYRAGMVIADTLRSVTEQWCPEGPTRLLDFACGYGRSLRFTIQDFGAEHVWGSEILPEAVRFVGDVLGAHAVQSATRPEDLDLEGPFDVIFVSSLFSHLPERTFTRWLQALHQRLSPTGLLVFSAHDEAMLSGDQELSPAGIYFGAASEIEDLDTQDYGVTIVAERFVAEAITAATGHRTYRRLPTALCFQQDLYLVPADPEADLDALVVRHGAQGGIDQCELDGRRFSMSGWALTQAVDARVERVEVRIDDQLVLQARPTSARPDVAAVWPGAAAACARAGWEAAVELPFDLRPDSTVVATARLSDGSSGVFWSADLHELRYCGVPDLTSEPVQPLSTRQQLRATLRAEGVTGLAGGFGRRLSRAAHALRSPALEPSSS